MPVWWGRTFPLESNVRGKLGWWMEMPEESLQLYVLTWKLALLALRSLVDRWLSLVVT